MPLTKKKSYKKHKPHKNSKNITTPKNSTNYKETPQPKYISTIKLLHINAAGLKYKVEDLKNKIKYHESTIISIQETHFRKIGLFKHNKYKTFESIRKNKEKGGSMLIVHEDLSPILIKEYNETFELLVVEVTTKTTPIRVITGYGPQENWNEADRMPFWVALEEEISSAELNSRSVIIQLDANAKLGKSYIKGDTHNMSVNGKVFSGIIERHALIVLKEKAVSSQL